MALAYNIRRQAVDGRRIFYLTPAGGWSPKSSKAEIFNDRQAAFLRLRNRIGFVAPVRKKA